MLKNTTLEVTVNADLGVEDLQPVTVVIFPYNTTMNDIFSWIEEIANAVYNRAMESANLGWISEFQRDTLCATAIKIQDTYYKYRVICGDVYAYNQDLERFEEADIEDMKNDYLQVRAWLEDYNVCDMKFQPIYAAHAASNQ